MDQYKSEGTINVPPVKPTTISEETRQLRSVESTVKMLQETVSMQQQEIIRLNREINRLKSGIDDVIAVVKSRG